MEMLEMYRKKKIKRNKHVSYKWRRGCLGEGGGYTVMYIKMLKSNRRQIIKDMSFTVLIRQ